MDCLLGYGVDLRERVCNGHIPYDTEHLCCGVGLVQVILIWSLEVLWLYTTSC